MDKKKGIKIGVIAGVIFILALIFNPLYVVNSTERALVLRFGAVQDQVVGAGIHGKAPIIDSVVKLSIQPFQIHDEIPVGSGGAITKDNQIIGATCTTFYAYKQDKLKEMYKDYGVDKTKAIVESASLEAIKATIGNYTIFDVAANQEKIQNECLSLLRGKLSAYPVQVTDLRIMNWDWSKEFDKQIQNTMEAAQQVKQKEQELLIAQNEAQKQVKVAEAAKQSTILEAQAQLEAAKLKAQAKEAEGEGIRKYNSLIAQNLNVQLELKRLDNEAARIDRWDGHYVPTNNYGPIPVSTGNHNQGQ